MSVDTPEGFKRYPHAGLDIDFGYLADFDRGLNPGNGFTVDERALLEALTRPGSDHIYEHRETRTGDTLLAVFQPE